LLSGISTDCNLDLENPKSLKVQKRLKELKEAEDTLKDAMANALQQKINDLVTKKQTLKKSGGGKKPPPA